MSVPSHLRDLEYPESDGRPMGESDLHRDWMFRIIELLRQRYRGQRVYVSGDLLLYFEEGDPKRFVVPDAFIVKDCDPGRRRVYKLWEERRAPDVVFETTSLSSKYRDRVEKPEMYEQLGVKEYFLYDPTREYLKPPLQGYRLEENGYARLEMDAAGALESRELGVLLRLENGDLVMIDAQTGERLQSQAEAEQAAHEAADARAESAEARAKAAEEELRRLRRRLGDADDSADA